MNFPLSVSNREPNNVLMFPDDVYDKNRACKQWMTLYKRISREALVYVLPGHNYLQDLPFVANLGCYIGNNKILLSNFTSPPRRGEAEIGRRFFESFDYSVYQSPHCWEGEADLKKIGNTYIGGIGQRSTSEAFQWMKNFDLNIVEIELTDPKLYHLDCVLMPLKEKLLVNTSALSDQDIGKLEQVAEIVSVPEQHKYEGWTNCIRLGDVVLHGLSKSWLAFERLLGKHGLHLEFFDLREFDKSGADLSCLVMHL